MKNDWTIDDYKTISDSKYHKVLPYVVIILFTVGILLVLCKFNIKMFKSFALLQENNQFFLIVDSKEILYLEKNKNLYIDGKKYQYQVLKVNSEYTNVNNIIYQTMYIKIDHFHTEAKSLNVFFLKSNKTILEAIIEFTKGGTS